MKLSCSVLTALTLMAVPAFAQDNPETGTEPLTLEAIGSSESPLAEAAKALMAEQYKSDPVFRILQFDRARHEHRFGDAKLAIRIYTDLATHAGHTPSMLMLGEMAYKGHGQEVDKEAAYDWTQKAAQKGDIRAMALTGFMNVTGNGTAKSAATARHWFLYAADRGSEEVDEPLFKMFRDGEGGPADPEMALVFAKRLASAGKTVGYYHMGKAYRDGAGVPQDLKEARNMLEEAADREYEGAAEALAKLAQIEQGQIE